MRLAAGFCPDPLGELQRSPRPFSCNRGWILLLSGRDKMEEKVRGIKGRDGDCREEKKIV